MNPFTKDVRETETGALLVTAWAVIIGSAVSFSLLTAALLGSLSN